MSAETVIDLYINEWKIYMECTESDGHENLKVENPLNLPPAVPT